MPATRTRSRGPSRDAARRPKPRSDAYTGLLILSLIALTVALVFAYLNWSEFPDKTPKASAGASPPAAAPGLTPPAVGPGGGARPGPGGAPAAPAAPAGGQQPAPGR